MKKSDLQKQLKKVGIELDDNLRYSPKIIYLNNEPSNYIICCDGSVYNIKTGKEKQATEMPNGYMKISLYLNNVKYEKYIHRLVAEAFIRNPKRKPEVNHKDRNKKNNDYTNLEWVTANENVAHAKMTSDNDIGSATGIPIHTDKQIDKAIRMLEKGKYSIAEICKKTNVSKQTLYDIKNKKAFQYKTTNSDFSNYEDFKDSKKYPDDKIKRVCELLVENKLTPVEIGKQTGIPQSYILEILNLKKRSSISKEYDFSNYDKKIYRHDYDESIVDKIDELLLKGCRNCEIRDILKFPNNTRYKSLVNNCKIRLRDLGKIK